jgi:hypothetical protein
MTCGPECIIGSIACVLCSITGIACFISKKKRATEPSPYFVGDPTDLENYPESPDQVAARLDDYIQRRRGEEAEKALQRQMGVNRAAGQPQQDPVPSGGGGWAAGVPRTTMLLPHVRGPGGGPAQVNIPYLQRHQLRHYPYAGAQVI